MSVCWSRPYRADPEAGFRSLSQFQRDQGDLDLLRGQSPVVAAEFHLEAVFFVPPDRLSLVGQDYQVPDPLTEFLRDFRAKPAALDQVGGLDHVGDPVEAGGEEGLGFVQPVGAEMQEQVPRRSGRDERLPGPVDGEEVLDPGEAFVPVEVDGRVGVHVHLAVVGGHHETDPLAAGGQGAGEERLHDGQEGQDFGLDLLGGRAVRMADAVQGVVVQADVGRVFLGGEQAADVGQGFGQGAVGLEVAAAVDHVGVGGGGVGFVLEEVRPDPGAFQPLVEGLGGVQGFGADPAGFERVTLQRAGEGEEQRGVDGIQQRLVDVPFVQPALADRQPGVDRGDVGGGGGRELGGQLLDRAVSGERA